MKSIEPQRGEVCQRKSLSQKRERLERFFQIKLDEGQKFCLQLIFGDVRADDLILYLTILEE